MGLYRLDYSDGGYLEINTDNGDYILTAVGEQANESRTQARQLIRRLNQQYPELSLTMIESMVFDEWIYYALSNIRPKGVKTND